MKELKKLDMFSSLCRSTDTVRRPEIKELTGIRGLLAWWVVFYHTRPDLLVASPRALSWFIAHGFLGVDLFFVLSGYVISYNYWYKFSTPDPNYYKRFLLARIARIYPVHLVTLLVTLAFYIAARVLRLPTNTDLSNWDAVGFASTLAMVHGWSGSVLYAWNGPSWSISMEWLAYLTFPLLVLTRLNSWSRWHQRAVALLLSTIAVCIHMGPGQGWILARIATCFPLGAVLYCLTKSATIPSWVFLVVSPLKCRWIMWQGRVSYSLYMTHAIVIMVLSKLLPLHTYGVVGAGMWLTTIGIVGAITHTFVEEPARLWLSVRLLSRSNVVRRPMVRAQVFGASFDTSQ